MKLLVQYCFLNNNLPQYSEDWNMHFWFSTLQTTCFKRSVTDGSFPIAFNKRCIFSWYGHRCKSAGVLTLSITWSGIQLQNIDRLIFVYGCCSQIILKASIKVHMSHLCSFTVSPFSSLTLQPHLQAESGLLIPSI